MVTPALKEKINQLVKDHPDGMLLDIGCGENKAKDALGNPFIGMDARNRQGVDIQWNVLDFPWPLPDESVKTAVCSHLVEHLNPTTPDSRLINLVKLLLDKKIISQDDIEEYIGEVDPGPLFMRFMDEVWRVLKPGGDFAIITPYATSPGMFQDPTHVNFINETTWEYFDPMSERTQGWLWRIYKPNPWKIKEGTMGYRKDANLEVCLVKRPWDKSYE